MGSNQASRKYLAHSPFLTMNEVGASPSLSWETTKSMRSPFRLLKVLMTLSGGTTGAFVIMSFSSLAGASRWDSRESSGDMMRAVLSRYQKKVEPGCRVMAWRRAGTRDQLLGAFLRGYWVFVGKCVR
jgi:hypothetical protein